MTSRERIDTTETKKTAAENERMTQRTRVPEARQSGEIDDLEPYNLPFTD